MLISGDEIDSAIGQEVGEVLAGGVVDGWRCLEIEVFSVGDDGFVEAALGWVVGPMLSEVPFAEHACGVTGLLQLFGEDGSIEGQFGDIFDGAEGAHAPVEAIDSSDRVDASADAILAAHQGCAGWGAVGAMVVIGKSNALRGEAIDIGGLIVLASVAGEIGVAQVIGHDKDDIGFGVLGADEWREGG